jgi:hypothetical protein
MRKFRNRKFLVILLVCPVYNILLPDVNRLEFLQDFLKSI